MGRSRNWPDLRSSIYKIRDIQAAGSYRLIIFCNFQSVQSSTLALTRFQSCKKVTWGQVIQTDLVTWSFKIGSCNLNIICKKDEGIAVPNFAALRAAVFLLSTKHLGGGISAPDLHIFLSYLHIFISCQVKPSFVDDVTNDFRGQVKINKYKHLHFAAGSHFCAWPPLEISEWTQLIVLAKILSGIY